MVLWVVIVLLVRVGFGRERRREAKATFENQVVSAVLCRCVVLCVYVVLCLCVVLCAWVAWCSQVFSVHAAISVCGGRAKE